MTKALQVEKAAVVALVRTLDIVFAFVLQLVFLDTQANPYSVAGATLVLLCNGVVMVSRWRERNTQEEAEEKAVLLTKYGK